MGSGGAQEIIDSFEFYSGSSIPQAILRDEMIKVARHVCRGHAGVMLGPIRLDEDRIFTSALYEHVKAGRIMIVLDGYDSASNPVLHNFAMHRGAGDGLEKWLAQTLSEPITDDPLYQILSHYDDEVGELSIAG